MAVAFAVTLFGQSLPARAGLELILTDVGTGAMATISDNPASINVAGGAPASTVVISTGTIAYTPTGGFGNFQIVSLTVTSNSPGGTGPSGSFVQSIQLDVNNTSGSADTLTLHVVSDGFTIPPAGTHSSLISTLTNNSVTGGTSTFQSFIGTGTTHIATTAPTFAATDMTSLQGPLSGVTTDVQTKGVTVPAGPSYALSQDMHATVLAGGSNLVTGLTTLSAVPEPATIVTAIVGVCLPLAGTVLKSRRRRQQA